MKDIELFSKKVIALINSGKIHSKEELNNWKIKLCKRFGIKEMPSNPDILSFAGKKNRKLVKLLGVKPVRTLSGIAVVALMTKPHKCPGNCIYCPSSLIQGIEVPKSYTGREPATMRAIKAKFNPTIQIKNRLQQLQETGHKVNKVELIVMGGTFLSQPISYQKDFMRKAINAVSGSNARTLEKAKLSALDSKNRVTGITFETRPDFCGKKEINRMLDFGGTRCELGVQTTSNKIYRKINRNHSVEDVIKATQLLKDSALKVSYHLMPGLLGSSFQEDLKSFKKIFSNQCFKPDMLKIYPTLVIKGTKLFKLWKAGKFKPLSTDEAVKLVSKVKEFVPHWIRIMRIQRDIPSNLIVDGVKSSNLRQLVQERMEKNDKKCNCIRCREAGLKFHGKPSKFSLEKAKLFIEEYTASNGLELFISSEDKKRQLLFGFCRLRLPGAPFRKEIDENTALVRELRVFGEPMAFGERKKSALQHHGLGKSLLEKAEQIAKEKFDSKKLLVNSGLGVKKYYYSLNFCDDGPFVSKNL